MYDKQSGTIFLGKSGDKKICIYPKMANRHGMICGATGTGKTITLKVLAESFSDMGVPVFLADIKGDLGSLAQSEEDVLSYVAFPAQAEAYLKERQEKKKSGKTGYISSLMNYSDRL